MDPQKLIQKEAIELGNVRSSVYLNYFAAVGYHWAFAVVMSNIISASFGLGTNVWLSRWSNDQPLPGNIISTKQCEIHSK